MEKIEKIVIQGAYLIKHFTLVPYGPNKISWTNYCMHAPAFIVFKMN